MPGIAGIFSHNRSDNHEGLIRLMIEPMKPEPLYISGTLALPEMGVFIGWISLEGSFSSQQTFHNEKKDVALILSGECFVDEETLIRLRHSGHEFNQETGEWLVHLYEEEGERFFERLNGLFSGVLIDKRTKKAFLFNDRYSVERIYWHANHEATYFASEAKALLRILPELRAFDEKGVADFLRYNCTLDHRTLFRDIQTLPGASVWSFQSGKVMKRSYFSPASWESQPLLSPKGFQREFNHTLNRVLTRYLRSDRQLGISLTGGLDTRMIMAHPLATKANPVCYTFVGNEGHTLDLRLGRSIAKSCGLEHYALPIDLDFFSDFACHVDRTVYVTDGNFGILGAHEIYFNRLARKLAPQRLTGNYGSEILRGMCTFKSVRLCRKLVNPELDKAMAASGDELARSRFHPVTFAAFREIPWSLFGSLAASRSQVGFRTPYLDNELVALAYRTPTILRTSALPALRFVSDTNRRIAQIPTDMGFVGGKHGIGSRTNRLFSKITFKLDYLNNEGLPNWLAPVEPVFMRALSGTGLIGLHKHLHYRGWFQRELSGYLRDSLASVKASFFNSAFVRRIADEHISGRKNRVLEINAVLTLDAIERLLFRGLPVPMRDGGSPEITPRHTASLVTT